MEVNNMPATNTDAGASPLNQAELLRYDKKTFPLMAREICSLGGTVTNLAAAFGVSEGVIRRWKSDHSEFRTACEEGQAFADNQVTASLHRCARGYRRKRHKIITMEGAAAQVTYYEEVPADLQAMIFY